MSYRLLDAVRMTSDESSDTVYWVGLWKQKPRSNWEWVVVLQMETKTRIHSSHSMHVYDNGRSVHVQVMRLHKYLCLSTHSQFAFTLVESNRATFTWPLNKHSDFVSNNHFCTHHTQTCIHSPIPRRYSRTMALAMVRTERHWLAVTLGLGITLHPFVIGEKKNTHTDDMNRE